MIRLETAQKLKAAGLSWTPAMFDFFAIPDRQLDDKAFVISDMLVTVDILQGLQVVSFQGASEWALDSLVTTDAVWLPHEGQLRQALEAGLLDAGGLDLKLVSGLSGYRCEMTYRGKALVFEANAADEAYAAALLHILQNR